MNKKSLPDGQTAVKLSRMDGMKIGSANIVRRVMKKLTEQKD